MRLKKDEVKRNELYRKNVKLILKADGDVREEELDLTAANICGGFRKFPKLTMRYVNEVIDKLQKFSFKE